MLSNQTESVNRAFSKQSPIFDSIEENNIVLKDLREQIYRHVERYLPPGSKILELNSGTGIDAIKFVNDGHNVYATDISEGMVEQLNAKIQLCNVANKLSVRQLSYEHLDQIGEKSFDFIFSNFGGLNCIQNLTTATRHFNKLLRPGARLTLVIMPRICLWEMAGVLKGNFGNSFRRFKKGGVMAHIEGEHFQTYYHSLREIKNAFSPDFRFIAAEGLAALSPPPHRGDIPDRHPYLYRFSRKLDASLRYRFPFNRWADHIIVTFEYKPRR